MLATDDDLNFIENAHYVADINVELTLLGDEPRNRRVIRSLLEHFLAARLAVVDGSADDWFNLATQASRVDYAEAQRRILEKGLEHHSDDVDLLCALFMFQLSNQNSGLADETWARLTGLGEEKVGPYWRYWVYGASHLARYQNDQDAAREFLDRGLERARIADLLQIYLHYREVLLDGGTSQPRGSIPSSVRRHATPSRNWGGTFVS